MVIASHIIFSAYGFWLPNDPRGSWSDWIRKWELFLHGKATKTDERRSVAHVSHDREQRARARSALRFDPVYFTGVQALAISRGFQRAIVESEYAMLACSILPNHVHAVVERHANPAERIIGHLKARATQQLIAENLHPFAAHRDASGIVPSAWAHRGWKVFLNNSDDVARAVEYVERNPEKEGKRRQQWSFVQPI